MDPNATYLEMYAAMKDGDHETAREFALALRDWLERGGFWPQNYTVTEVRGYLANVLRRTNPLKGEAQSLFPVGQTVITPAAQEALSDLDVRVALKRHQRGDWGDCNPEDTAENELALEQGLRLFSVYHTEQRVKFWVITEADRSSTCILLPEDY